MLTANSFLPPAGFDEPEGVRDGQSDDEDDEEEQ
jgi:hypothetical protein